VHLYSKKWSFSISKNEYTVTVSAEASPRRDVARACTPRVAPVRRPLSVRARGHRRPRQPAVPGRAPSPGHRRTPRRLDCPAPRASLSSRRTRAAHKADCRSVRSPAVCSPAEERRSTAASRPSSSRRHRRSTAQPIKGASASPRAGTEPPAAIAVLAPSSILHNCSEPPNHVFPFLRPC
jgi:hypothetical protein